MMDPICNALKCLDQSQASISATRKLCLDPSVDPMLVMRALADEIRSSIPYQKRLAVFYLFNDIIQYAARDHNVPYLELGSNIFLPVVSQYLERLSLKEKAPFIRTLAIWDERHVLSKNYVQKLREHWQSTSQESKHISDASESRPPIESALSSDSKSGRTVVRGDPKSFDIETVQHRLMSQSASNGIICERIASLIPPNPDGFIEVKAGKSSFPDFDPITALQAGLIAEMNDLISYLVLLKANECDFPKTYTGN